MSPSKRFLSLLLSSFFLLATVTAAPKQRPKQLEECVTDALVGNDTQTRVQTPDDPTWEDARVGAIIKPEFPAMIAFATQMDEVAPLIACASKNGYQPIPRSGRHHFEGWSALNGSLVIDVSHINHITVSENLETAVIGAGANLGQIYTTLSTYGKTFLGGICPSVALGGYLGAGGYNLQQRQLGLAVDQIVSFKVVVASGELLTVSPTQHPDLWWAARGGGMFGLIVETTVKILTLPRSAMVAGFFPNKTTRYDVTKTYLDWAPKQAPEFNSQLNVYSNRSHFIGWYLGGTVEELQSIMEESGLLDIPGAKVSITGNCSTENSRMYWMDPETTCTDDETAYDAFLQLYNTMPIHLTPLEPEFRLEDTAALPSEPTAHLWPRFGVIAKTYFTLKSKPLSDAALAEFIDRTGALDEEAGFWGEWTTFNITAPATSSSFAWQEEAQTLMRMEVASGHDPQTYAKNQDWMNGFDGWFRAEVGSASYAGYIDAGINVNPYTAYYGDSICRLIEVKKMYDPEDVFRNPQSIPTSTPEGVSC